MLADEGGARSRARTGTRTGTRTRPVGGAGAAWSGSCRRRCVRHGWLAADSDGRDPRDPGLGNGISCDFSGCIGKLADGRLVAYALAPDAFEEDCRRATIIVATRDAPPGCAATVIGCSLWRARGALAIRRDGAGFATDSAPPTIFDRPWAPNVAQQAARAAAANSDTAPGDRRPHGRSRTMRHCGRKISI